MNGKKKKQKKGKNKQKAKQKKQLKKKEAKKVKKAKKIKKIQKLKKAKKGRKSQTKKTSKKVKQSGGESSSCSTPDSCILNAMNYLRMNKDKVTNYRRQVTRIMKQNATAGKKVGKKNVFKGGLTRLLEAGGGNASAMMCGSSSSNAGAADMKSLVDNLMGCSDNVKMACDPSNLPQPNMTAIAGTKQSA